MRISTTDDSKPLLAVDPQGNPLEPPLAGGTPLIAELEHGTPAAGKWAHHGTAPPRITVEAKVYQLFPGLERKCARCGSSLPLGAEISRAVRAIYCSEACLDAALETALAANPQIGPRFAPASLDNFEAATESQGIAHRAVIFWTEDAGEPTKTGLLLLGPTGTRKTWLAVGAYRRLLAAGKKVSFAVVPDILLDIQRRFRNDKGDSDAYYVLDGILASDWIILDDIGVTKPTEFVVQTLYYLVNCIYRQMRRALITCNFTLEELEERLGEPRITSRLAGMCDAYVLDGPDRRSTRA